MKFPRFLPSLAALCLFSTLLPADEAEDALLAAAARGDAPRVVQALFEAAPDTRDAQGHTALMLAAQAGDFESVRRLLWGGANAQLKDPQGRMARDFLNPKGEAFAPLSLILRCYAFVQQNGRPGNLKARIPHLTLINDFWVDPSHPKLKPLYQVNLREQNGRPGVDDDANGFTDDVYGWNFQNDEPMTAPQLSIDNSAANQRYLAQLMKDFFTASSGDDRMHDLLAGSYKNPLVRQIGFQNLDEAGIDLNDFTYAEMLYAASHGTHVAGIVAQYSDRKALIHGTAIGAAVPTSGRVLEDMAGTVRLASQSADYATFIAAFLDRYRAEAVTKGRRASDYLRVCGAGVANMSWGRTLPFRENYAKQLEQIYRKNGKVPSSVDAAPPAQHALMLANMPLELAIADAAAFALAFYENPDVLITISAGNSAENNDELLPSPQYLSRFFPNVITIASVSANGKPSSFTNFGVRSVQLAAPGEQINSTILAGLEAPMTGTSMASPVVAGVAAGIRAQYPTLGARDIRRILEASALRSEGLAKHVSTSGQLNAAAAKVMAATWSRTNQSMLVEEARRAKVPGRDGPALKVPELVAPKLADLQLTPSPVSKEPRRRITTVAGSGTYWRAVMSSSTRYNSQRHLGVGEWPAAGISENWEKGLRITSVAGDRDGWNVVMSDNVPGLQAVYGFDFDQTRIAESMGNGFRITAVAGWKESWIVVMNTETGLGEQRYTLPTPLTDSRKEWIKKRWDEGYRITAVAGDDHPEIEDDGWLFVVSKNSGINEQLFTDPGPWPESWVQARLAEGYVISSLAGGEGRCMVVMSKGPKLENQVFSPGGAFPSAWIKERW